MGYIEYKDWPDWLSEEAIYTLKDGYLNEGETPKQVYELISRKACEYLNRPDLYNDIFYCLYMGWIGTASAFFSNFGRDKGLPISCNMIHLEDSIQGIYKGISELAALSQNGAGVAVTLNDIRPAGSPISRGGTSVGTLPVARQIDMVGSYVSQDSRRPGAVSINLSILHKDVPDILRAKDHLQGDHRKHIDCNIGLTVPSIFMEGLKNGNKEYAELWALVLETQLKTGSPYLLFEDNVNNHRTESYIKNNLKITASNICVVGSTKILTSKGYQSIESLVNNKVEVWNGKQFSEVDVVKTGKDQEVLTINTNSGMSLTCTPYHKFYVQKGYKQGTGVNKLEIIEKRANELNINDKLIKFDLPIIEGKEFLELAYENGFYTGDGCFVKKTNQQRIYLYDDKQKLKQYINNTKWIDQPKQNRSYCHFTELKDKYFIPGENYTIQSRLNWLAGLLDSDGCVLTNKNSQAQSIQLVSINKHFLVNLQLMLQCLGVHTKISLHNEAGLRPLPKNDGSKELELYNCKTSYRLLINSFGIEKLINLGLNTRRLTFNKNNCNRESLHFVKISSIKKEDLKQDVYCFNEPLEHKGMFNGILTGNCQEIVLYTDKNNTFVCCLCSLNLATWEEWKRWKGTSGKSVAEIAVYLLDAGLDDYILKGSKIPGLENAIRSVQKERSIGVGTMGIHYLYQSKNLPFKSYKARQLNKKIFKQIQEQTTRASIDLGIERGIPQWCVGRRNACLQATAPTRTNSVISGAFSAGIEPNDSNYYVAKQSKGNFIRRNKHLEVLLESKGKNTEEVWDSILFKNGSVFHLDFLTFDEKLVFATAREVDQQELIRQASERQQFIDQSQSLNRFYHPNIPAHIINEHIFTAYNNNIKTLYYTRTSSPQQLERVKGDCYIVTKDDCKYCKELKILLDKVGIKYVEIDKGSIEHFPWRTVPQVWYEGCYIGGYEDMKTLIYNKQSQVPVSTNVETIQSENLNKQDNCKACEA